MKLHRALRSDWSGVAPQQRNIWQRYAARTHGIVTPANFISLVGVLLTLRGLLLLAHDHFVSGLILLLIGRLADILDGLVADYTKTKSPLGEAIDASADKLLILATAIVLLASHLLPLFLGILMGLHALYNTSISLLAKQLHSSLHPSRTGKLSAVFEWAAVGLYILLAYLRQQQRPTVLVHVLALITVILFILTAAISSINYTRHTYYKRTAGA